MDFLKTRNDLRRMGMRELFRITTNQKIRVCIICGEPCRFYFRHENFNFCVSEILREGCQLEKLDKSEEVRQKEDETIFLQPFIRELEMGLASTEKKAFEFRVYFRDRLTHSMPLLGKIKERRKKERKNNLQDLLIKAIGNFSNQVRDPSEIFLMGS